MAEVVSPTVARYLGITDRAQITGIIADAEIARARQHVSWWQKPEFRGPGDPSQKFIDVFDFIRLRTARLENTGDRSA